MNKKVAITISLAFLLITGAVTYALLRPSRGTDLGEPAVSSQQSPATTSTAPSANTPAGALVEYSAEAVRSTTGTKLLFFHAPWCSQCREIEASINEDGVPNGVTVFKVDYDSNQTLRQKYGVTLQTTFVKIDDQGNKVASYVAYEEPQFSAVVRELL